MCFSYFRSKELRSLRVVRVELDNGRRLVGLRYPEPLITEVAELIRQQKLNAFAVCNLLILFGNEILNNKCVQSLRMCS